MLLAWSMAFRVRATFVNYVGYVRTGCLIAGCSVDAFSDPAVQKAKWGIDDSVNFERRPPTFLQLPLVRALVLLGKRRLEFAVHSMLYLCTYVFLLRLPSEAMPLTAWEGDSSLAPGDDPASPMLVCTLRRRKNKPRGSVLSRRCWCAKDKVTCPVHVLLPRVMDCPKEARLFQGISRYAANAKLRKMLTILEVPDASKYSVHDCRRGHAKGMQVAGMRLACIVFAYLGPGSLSLPWQAALCGKS